MEDSKRITKEFMIAEGKLDPNDPLNRYTIIYRTPGGKLITDQKKSIRDVSPHAEYMGEPDGYSKDGSDTIVFQVGNNIHRQEL